MKANPLPYNRTPEFMSPTSLQTLESQPINFYFNYCGPVKYREPRQPQTAAMAYGSAFDGEIKLRLARLMNERTGAQVFKLDDYGLTKYIDKSLHSDQVLLTRARAICDAYWGGPPSEDLREHGALVLEGDPRVVNIEGVPLYGKIDVLSGEPRVVDFKVTGAASKNPISRIPGYMLGWQYSPGGEYVTLPAHKRANDHLELLQPDWATQLATYHMIGGGSPDMPAPVGIDQVTFLAKGKMQFTSIRTTVSAEFVRATLERYKAAWLKVKSRTVVPERYAAHGVEYLRMFKEATW